MSKLANKRKTKRVDCLVPVEGKEEGLFGDVKTVDFSKTGLGFISKRKIPLNQEIVVELDLDKDGEQAFVVGVVKWVRKSSNGDYRIGLHFKEILRGSKTRLERYFRK